MAGASCIVLAMSMPMGCQRDSSAQSPRPTITISVEPTDIVRGDTVTVRWSTSGATACIASGGWRGPRAMSGKESFATTDSGKIPFTLDCTGAGGTAKNGAFVISHRGVSPP